MLKDMRGVARLSPSPTSHSVVMPGFRPGIHEFAAQKLVDAKAKPWHDGLRDGKRVFGFSEILIQKIALYKSANRPTNPINRLTAEWGDDADQLRHGRELRPL